jgi:hypothetical protein
VSIFHQAQTKIRTNSVSREGVHYSHILRNEPEITEKQREEAWARTVPKFNVSRNLPSVYDIDLEADRAAYRRMIKSGYAKDEAMQLVYSLRRRRADKRAQQVKDFPAANLEIRFGRTYEK